MKKRLFGLLLLFLLIALPFAVPLAESKGEVLVVSGKHLPIRIFDGQRYLSLYALCLALGEGEATPVAKESICLAVNTPQLEATIQDGSHLVVANGRYLYSDYANIYRDKVLYVPFASAVKAVGGQITHREGNYFYLETNKQAAIAKGEDYYAEDKVLWLSRIIHAESGNQPLAGKIAVGTVVMNRVDHPDYPDTIYGVIFDKKYGVQFTPTENGTIWCEPGEESIVAAKIVLEGYRTDPDILFFMNEDIAASTWISDNCDYAFTIEDHSFWS
jgi:N-acetylmuramoyl-L-alanine amidase